MRRMVASRAHYSMRWEGTELYSESAVVVSVKEQCCLEAG